jgi:hypothetical protein
MFEHVSHFNVVTTNAWLLTRTSVSSRSIRNTLSFINFLKQNCSLNIYRITMSFSEVFPIGTPSTHFADYAQMIIGCLDCVRYLRHGIWQTNKCRVMAAHQIVQNRYIRIPYISLAWYHSWSWHMTSFKLQIEQRVDKNQGFQYNIFIACMTRRPIQTL